LDKRLQRIEKGETAFKNWDFIKGKYVLIENRSLGTKSGEKPQPADFD